MHWTHYVLATNCRKMSRYIDKDKTGKAIRQKFLDYFINKNHTFIKSSPVVPFCDPTVAFVNAGMNQFKGVFLGNQQAAHKKVTNYQKCIRVGGKHNDLNVVGSDGYHHTFFEMLGNWSFGDYFKREACELAWKLLTEEYKIPQSRLYVTYYKGDPVLGVGEDLETKEIWEAIGVPKDRILPFASKDNFWEMGPTGPCGPCTEIHLDHITSNNRGKLVNKGLHDLTELWNIVFIQYNRITSESIEPLREKHVDTGMGFERLTSFLQGKISNFDTDNFAYLLKAIHKNCRNIAEYQGKFGESDWNRLDTAYRILSDHARMIAICLGDSMIPEQNQKLRRIMRRSFLISETVFNTDKGLLREISNYIIEHLAPVYPELERNARQIHQIIDYEEEVYKAIRKTASEEWAKLAITQPALLELDINETPSLVAGYKEILSANPKLVDARLAFKLYDTFGLDEEAIGSLARVLGLTFDANGFLKELEVAKTRSQRRGVQTEAIVADRLARDKIPATKRSDLYNYTKNGTCYIFKDLQVSVLRIIKGAEFVSQVEADELCSLVLDRSNLYTEAGGQIGDRGTIAFSDSLFEITEVQDLNGHILHKGFLPGGGTEMQLTEGSSGVLKINAELRLANMRNHTAVHLLNSALKSVKAATCQKSSKVTPSFLNLDVGVFGDKLSLEDLQTIEVTIKRVIQNRSPVNVVEVDSQTLTNMDNVTLIPGEVYPESGIRVVEIKGSDGFLSREPCCGTHVLNTEDLGDFCVVGAKSLGRATASIHAVTGERAQQARVAANELLNTIEKFEKSIKDDFDKPDVLTAEVSNFKQQLNYDVEDSRVLPILIKHKCTHLLNKISKQIKEAGRKNLKELIEVEMRNALKSNVSKTKTNRQYLVHYLRSSLFLENVSLQKVTKFCVDMPVLVISYSDNMAKARCCVPEKLRSEDFDAEKWLTKTVGAVFKSDLVPPKGYNPSLVSNMKAKRVKSEDWDPLLQEAIEAAKKYVEQHL